MLVITIENNILPGASHIMGAIKTDRFVYGFGLSNIRHALENIRVAIPIPIPDPQC